MMKKDQRQKTLRLRPDTADTLEAVAEKHYISQARAFDLIVQEWIGAKEMKPLSAKNQSDWAILQNTLDNIDARLSCIGDKTEGIDAELFNLEFGKLCAIEDRLDRLLSKLNQAVDLANLLG